MTVYCIADFITTIEKLQANNSYSGVLTDVCDFLADKDIAELHQIKDILRKTDGIYSLNKYRIINSKTNKGKSGSYRCVCVCLPQKDEIYLGYIYPKTGSQGKENLTAQDFKNIAKAVQVAISTSNLYVLDIISKKYKKLS
ncbi:MAG TPA: hypothetical protein PLW44_11995 [Chitinophagales bacterium]|nr:hypothetical protein [Chitinophagales bacterium]